MPASTQSLGMITSGGASGGASGMASCPASFGSIVPASSRGMGRLDRAPQAPMTSPASAPSTKRVARTPASSRARRGSAGRDSAAALQCPAMKTSAARILDGLGLRYELRTYEVGDEHAPAAVVAEKVGLPPEQVFKTL